MNWLSISAVDGVFWPMGGVGARVGEWWKIEMLHTTTLSLDGDLRYGQRLSKSRWIELRIGKKEEQEGLVIKGIRSSWAGGVWDWGGGGCAFWCLMVRFVLSRRLFALGHLGSSSSKVRWVRWMRWGWDGWIRPWAVDVPGTHTHTHLACVGCLVVGRAFSCECGGLAVPGLELGAGSWQLGSVELGWSSL